MTGVYSRVRPGFVCGPGRGAVFLDRDGVVIEDTDYLSRVEDIQYLGGAVDAIARINAAGWPVVMVTNQAGVGRGYYSWREFEAVQAALELRLAESGAWLDGIWACAYHRDGVGEFRSDNHTHRKPNPGMLRDAASRMGIDLTKSWMVGDKVCDIEAGLNAGVAEVVHVETGYGRELRDAILSRFAGRDPIRFCADLPETASLILKACPHIEINGKT
jgi:D-glycero-D-manno-heptose 1,7-bisphosphate phosphatase